MSLHHNLFLPDQAFKDVKSAVRICMTAYLLTLVKNIKTRAQKKKELDMA